jgi:glycosyltransferase involved in cell wall biosynthesis
MHLTLFFTRGNSLAKWHSIGSLEREIALYQALQDQGIQVSLVTYGVPGEEKFLSKMPGLEICYNRWKFPLVIYEWIIPWLHSKTLKKSDLFKTNQVKGAHVALISGLMWHKPVMVRQGYSWSNTLSKEKRFKLKAVLARLYENLVYKKAYQVIVTTLAMQSNIVKRCPEVEGRISVIPNYVDTDLFRPVSDPKSSQHIIYVGRLAKEKNLFALINAAFSTGIPLKIIGSGPLEENLRQHALQLKHPISFLGTVPNQALPQELNQASIFVLPSFYEGQPKVLLEAMSCGLAVIGTDVEGIRDLIEHGETGWLCQVDAESIREAIQYLLTNPDLCRQLGKNARTFVLNNFSLDNILVQEIGLYHRLLSTKSAHEPTD